MASSCLATFISHQVTKSSLKNGSYGLCLTSKPLGFVDFCSLPMRLETAGQASGGGGVAVDFFQEPFFWLLRGNCDSCIFLEFPSACAMMCWEFSEWLASYKSKILFDGWSPLSRRCFRLVLVLFMQQKMHLLRSDSNLFHHHFRKAE